MFEMKRGQLWISHCNDGNIIGAKYGERCIIMIIDTADSMMSYQAAYSYYIVTGYEYEYHRIDWQFSAEIAGCAVLLEDA